MDVSFLSTAQAKTTLIDLTRSCDAMQWAVAWGTENLVLDEAMRHKNKFEHFVIGTHLYQTHPAVLKRVATLEVAAVMPPTGNLFHPKVYLFRNGRRIRGVVGSPNLTLSAMTRNIEASVLIDGTLDDLALAELSSFVKSAWEDAEYITPDFLYRYEHQWAAKRAAMEDLEKFVDIRPPKQRDSAKAPQAMGWDDYMAQLRSSEHPSADLFDQRLRVLQEARNLFARNIPFAKWDLHERKLVAGTLGRKQSKQPGVDYGLFGAMNASGAFANLVIDDPAGLSAALDKIPLNGPVSEKNFSDFCTRFSASFKLDGRQGRLPTASRLLALKRPDIFVCVDSANRESLCEQFGIPPTTTTLTNYWPRIIEPMQLTQWWRHSSSTKDSDHEIWLGRAALLDAIYYKL